MAAAGPMHRPTPLPRGPNSSGLVAGPHFQSTGQTAPGGLNLDDRRIGSSGFRECAGTSTSRQNEAAPARRLPTSVRRAASALSKGRAGLEEGVRAAHRHNISSFPFLSSRSLLSRQRSAQVLFRASSGLPDLYRRCNPGGFLWTQQGPVKRYLTNPHVPAGNAGFDNLNQDLILAVGDVLVSEGGKRCAVLLR